MATGYTHPVKDGKITTLGQFVWTCARAFGALILMRDEPRDVPIPDAFKPSDTYQQWASKTADELGALEAMSDELAAAAAISERNEAIRYRDEYIARKQVERQRYEAMLTKVKTWEAPSSEHVRFREFMIEQLTESIEHDCSDYEPSIPEPLTGAAWKDQKIARLTETLARDRKRHAEEVARTEERNRWIRLLRESVPYEAPPSDA